MGTGHPTISTFTPPPCYLSPHHADVLDALEKNRNNTDWWVNYHYSIDRDPLRVTNLDYDSVDVGVVDLSYYYSPSTVCQFVGLIS